MVILIFDCCCVSFYCFKVNTNFKKKLNIDVLCGNENTAFKVFLQSDMVRTYLDILSNYRVVLFSSVCACNRFQISVAGFVFK